jgi:hypothetical protein
MNNRQEIKTVNSLEEIQIGTQGMMDVSDDTAFANVLAQTRRDGKLTIRSIRQVPDLARARRLDAMGIEHPPIGSQRLIFVSRKGGV